MALLAQSGHSLRRNSLSAFGQERTKLGFDLGTICQLLTQSEHWLWTAAMVWCRFHPLSKHSFEPLRCHLLSLGSEHATARVRQAHRWRDRKSTRLNSSHLGI